MAKRIDLTGEIFGRWTVLYLAGRTNYGLLKWYCRCACGKEKVVLRSILVNGESQSCGCKPSIRRTTHGHTTNRAISSEYSSWLSMKVRCSLKTHHAYKHYGGAGISVCERWVHSFENFLLDMGPKPTPKHSIDRINSKGNYEPSNCRWATSKEQSRNKSTNVYVTFMGDTKTVSDWAEAFGVERHVISNPMRTGKGIDEIIPILKVKKFNKGLTDPIKIIESKLRTGDLTKEDLAINDALLTVRDKIKQLIVKQ
jgi:hypothetical protein